MNKTQKIIIFTILGILTIPLIAMQFTTEVNWSLFDFIIMGSLLLSTSLLCEFIYRKTTNKNYKFLYIIGIIVLFILIWIELAVGLFNSPLAGS